MEEEYENALANQEEEDKINQINRFLSRKIEDERVFLRKSITEQKNLKNKLESLKEELVELNEENSQLAKEYPDNNFTISTFQGDFFQQLRAIEATDEYGRAYLTAMKACNGELQNELQTSKSKSLKLEEQNKDLEEKILISKDQLGKRKSDLAELQETEREMTLEENKLKDELLMIKQAAHEKADEIKQVAKESIEELFTQREILQNEVSNLKKELANLEENGKEEKRKSLLNQKKIQEGNKKQSSTMWMSERVALIAKVKKAHQELMNLSRRHIPSSSSASSKRGVQFKQPVIADNDIKKALALEIAEIKGTNIKFLEESLKTEISFNKSLQKELSDIDKSVKSITTFKDSTILLLNQQKNTSQNTMRIELLRQELKQLKSLL